MSPDPSPDSIDSALNLFDSSMYMRSSPINVDPLDIAQSAFDWPWVPYQKELLLKLLDPSWRRLLVCAPPRHRKTTIVALFIAISVGLDPATRIMVASHTRDYSALMMNQAEAIMRLPIYKRYFGDLLPKPGDNVKWTTYERHLPNRPITIKDPTFLALSPGAATPGFGAEIIVADDLVTQGNSMSAVMRKHIERWLDGSLLKRLTPNGRVLCVGARFYKQDLYGTLKKRGTWEYMGYEASVANPLWPERWPSELLAEKELEDPVFFPAQYLQDPVELGAGALDPSWFRLYVQHPELSTMAIYAGLDPIIKERGSKWGQCVIGRDPTGNIYVLDAMSGRFKDTLQPQLIDEIYRKWQPHIFLWESSGTQESTMNFVNDQLTTPAYLVAVPSLVSKYLRLSAIAGHVRQGKVLLPGTMSRDGNIEPTPIAEAIINAWGSFPGGDQDIIDSFEKCVSKALEGPPPAMGVQTEAERRKARQDLENEGITFETPRFIRVFRENYAALSPDD